MITLNLKYIKNEEKEINSVSYNDLYPWSRNEANYWNFNISDVLKKSSVTTTTSSKYYETTITSKQYINNKGWY